MNWSQHPKCYHVGQTGTGRQRAETDWPLVDESKSLPHLCHPLSTVLTSPAALFLLVLPQSPKMAAEVRGIQHPQQEGRGGAIFL